MTKYTYGVSLLVLSSIANGITSGSAAQDFSASCKLKTVYDASKLGDIAVEANRSINGLYFAVGKIANAVMPFAQTESCMICANDATINNYYSNNNFKINQASFNSMLKSLGEAANDFNTALSNMLAVVADVYLKYVIDLDASASNCSDIVKSILTSSKWCIDNDNCTKEMTGFFANTLL